MQGSKQIQISEQLGLIDLTFFQFCDSRLKAETFEGVDFGLVSLENDRQGITRNTFQANIPAYSALNGKLQVTNTKNTSEKN
jgi:hypothetical protein